MEKMMAGESRGVEHVAMGGDDFVGTAQQLAGQAPVPAAANRRQRAGRSVLAPAAEGDAPAAKSPRKGLTASRK